MHEDFNGKTGMLRAIERDVAIVSTKVKTIESDHRELRDELKTELASVHEQLRHHGSELRLILIWSKAAAVLVPTSIGGTVAVVAYLLSKVPVEAWASLLK